MNVDDAKALARAQGEHAVVFMAALRAIMKATPNFDQKKFAIEIAGIIGSPHTTEHQKGMFRTLLD